MRLRPRAPFSGGVFPDVVGAYGYLRVRFDLFAPWTWFTRRRWFRVTEVEPTRLTYTFCAKPKRGAA